MSELKIINIDGVDCYEHDGTAYLKLEAVARGLGFTTVATSGNEVVRWKRVEGYLKDLGVPTCGHDDFIPENIFYRLAMKAKNEVAEKFQAKVADEIIPSIRKHGGYIAGQEKLSDDELLERAVLVARRKIEERDKIIAQKQERIKEMIPKEVFADSVVASKTSIPVGSLVKILNQNGINIGSHRLFDWLRQNGYLNERKGRDWSTPTQQSVDAGWFEIKESTAYKYDGSIIVNRTTLVTGAGQLYFINKFLGRRNKENNIISLQG